MIILGYLLAGTAILYSLPYIVAIPLSIVRQGLTDTVRDLRDLAHGTAADQPPPRGHQRRGPQPPRKAVQVDRELTYNPYLMYDDPGGIDMDRILQMKDALTEDEYDQLTLFWGWLRDTGQISSDNTPDTPPSETGRRTYPPTTDEKGRPIIFDDQL